MQPADVPAVVELVKATLAEFGLTFGEGSATDAQVTGLPDSYHDAGGAFWVVFDGDTLLGTAGVMPIAEGTFELRKMYLARAARGHGVGKMLLDVCVQHTRDVGARMLVLDTAEQMTAAIRFYERNGFVRDDAQIRGARCTRGYALSL